MTNAQVVSVSRERWTSFWRMKVPVRDAERQDAVWEDTETDALGQRHSLPLERFWCVVVWILTDTVTENFIIFMKPSVFPWLPSLLNGMYGFRESWIWILSHQSRSWSKWSLCMALVVDSDLRLSLGSGIMWLSNIVNAWNISESKSLIVQCR